MSTTTMINTINTPQQSRGKDNMTIASLLNEEGAATLNAINNAVAPASPSTPVNGSTMQKEEALTPSSDTTMLDVASTTDDSGDIEDVPDCDREFICMNDESSRCLTGQYTKNLSRKVISDHFGRNKACTRDITNWPLFCRKHYQRATYNKPLWQIRKLGLIHRQFNIIEQQFPGTTYNIHLKKSEEARLNEYSRKVASGKSDEYASDAVAPKPSTNFEAPIKVLRELDLDLGNNKSIDEAKDVVERILEMITGSATTIVPSIEFLPNIPGKTPSPKKKSPIKKAPKTPTPKKARAPKTSASKITPGRVSAKGSVKKPGQ